MDYLSFWCLWPVAEVDKVATHEAWVTVAGRQQAYDRSSEGTSDRRVPTS